jgi:hypothetical protein
MAHDEECSPCQEGIVNFSLLVPRDVGHVDSGGVDAQLRVGDFTDLRQPPPASAYLYAGNELFLPLN